MLEKPSFASDYKREDLELVRQTCLYVATKLGDLLDDLVVVGGLVPSLLIPDESLTAVASMTFANASAHCSRNWKQKRRLKY
jgi:hypothetical protein